MTTALRNVTAVYRKYACDDCGHRHSHGVHVDIEDWGIDGDHANGRPVTGRWLCDECGSEWWVEDVRLVPSDFSNGDIA
jgi:uncharacterized protein YlaI